MEPTKKTSCSGWLCLLWQLLSMLESCKFFADLLQTLPGFADILQISYKFSQRLAYNLQNSCKQLFALSQFCKLCQLYQRLADLLQTYQLSQLWELCESPRHLVDDLLQTLPAFTYILQISCKLSQHLADSLHISCKLCLLSRFL